MKIDEWLIAEALDVSVESSNSIWIRCFGHSTLLSISGPIFSQSSSKYYSVPYLVVEICLNHFGRFSGTGTKGIQIGTILTILKESFPEKLQMLEGLDEERKVLHGLSKGK